MSLTVAELYRRFSPNMLDNGNEATVDAVTFSFRELAERLEERLPDGRAKSLALTALEEALIWSYRSIASGEEGKS